ncbi:MAG: hypothetical protein AB7O44_19940 [Hyphomicrobiaceae bacterium]
MKLTRLPASFLVIDTSALVRGPRSPDAATLLAAVKKAGRGSSSLRDVVVQVLKAEDAILEDAKYVIIDDQPPKELPVDRVRYRDRGQHPELSGLGPLDFLKSQYGDFVDQGKLYQHQLAIVDPQLLKAIRNYAARHPEKRAVVATTIKTRYEFARERVEIDDAAKADAELQRDIKSMAYNLNKNPPRERG